MKEQIALVQKRTFAVVLELEGGLTVRVPSLPEIVNYGKDEREALATAEDYANRDPKLLQILENIKKLAALIPSRAMGSCA